MDLSMKEKQTHQHREQTWEPRAGVWGGVDWEFGVTGCKLTQVGWINNSVLLFSTGNYTQCPVINIT